MLHQWLSIDISRVVKPAVPISGRFVFSLPKTVNGLSIRGEGYKQRGAVIRCTVTGLADGGQAVADSTT